MSLPKIPGLISDYDPTRVEHKKISHVHLEKVQNAKNKAVPLYALPHPPPQQPTHLKDPKSMSFSQTVHSGFGDKTSQLYEPVFTQLDKQVLRFFGFFQESVVESALETSKLRKVTLLYYLEDHSIQISEPKQVNSGTPQGIFLKRQTVLKADGEPIYMEDLRVGGNIEIYGRNIHIVACDPYTRDFYTNLGKPQEENKEMPQDSFEKSLIKPYVPKDNTMKEFMEKALGGGRVKSEKQFLDNDRKVLRFYSTCDGLTYVIHYFTADDTIEVREVHFQNSGRDNFPLLLKRQKIPDSFDVGQPGLIPETSFFTEDQFQPDEPFIAFNHVFLIFGVDAATQRYYESKYKRHFPLAGIEQPKAPDNPALVVPPYNGFGDEQDSLGYVYRLIPKPPKKDHFKYVDNEKDILRYTAKLNTTVPEDIERRFIISIYLGDDTLSVFEPAQKNSGIKEGKFLERGKYKLKEGGKVVTPGDLEIGGDVVINSYSFRILSCDLFTEKWRAQHLCD